MFIDPREEAEAIQKEIESNREVKLLFPVKLPIKRDCNLVQLELCWKWHIPYAISCPSGLLVVLEWPKGIPAEIKDQFTEEGNV
jgi:hypothetical protein